MKNGNAALFVFVCAASVMGGCATTRRATAPIRSNQATPSGSTNDVTLLQPESRTISLDGKVVLSLVRVSTPLNANSPQPSNITPNSQAGSSASVDIWIGKQRVTQGLWQQLMGSNPSSKINANFPVDNVSAPDCMSFCKKLTDRERSANTLLSNYEYRPPTEDEMMHLFSSEPCKGNIFQGFESGYEWCVVQRTGASIVVTTSSSGGGRILCGPPGRLIGTEGGRDSQLGFRIVLAPVR